jgi:hypothetical protein
VFHPSYRQYTAGRHQPILEVGFPVEFVEQFRLLLTVVFKINNEFFVQEIYNDL